MTATASAIRNGHGLLISIQRDKHDIDVHRLVDPDHLAAYDDDPEGFVTEYVARYCASANACTKADTEPEVGVQVKVSEKDVAAAEEAIAAETGAVVAEG